MRNQILRLLSFFLLCASLATSQSACGTEVCEAGTGPLSEVKVNFKGFDLGRAAVLEFDSTVTGPKAAEGAMPFHTRRIGRMAFPGEARDGSATYIFDPGYHFMQLANENVAFNLVVWIRVYDDTGLLLAEGRYSLAGKTDQCWLGKSITVSTSQTCNEKVSGDACASRSGTPYVCKSAASGLSCEASSCGDGFVDRQNGELCDPAVASDVSCAGNCLPTFVDHTVWESGPQWFEVDTATAPSPRMLAAGAVLPSSGQLVLFGGQDDNGAPLGDTWLFDGTAWTQHTGGAAPTPRYGHTMAVDPDRDVILLFGGSDETGADPTGTLSDVWEYSTAGGWRLVNTGASVGPSARLGAAMAYHPGDGGTTAGFVLFGGKFTAGTNNTYRLAWDGGSGDYAWQELGGVSPGTARRWYHTLTWVPALSALRLTGGQSGTAHTNKGSVEVWSFSDSAWTRVDAENLPLGLARHQAVAGPTFAELVVVGGSNFADDNENSERNRAVMTLATGAWASLTPANGPAPRTGHVAFYLPGPGALFTFGGRVELTTDSPSPVALANDTWRYHPEDNPAADIISAAGVKIRMPGETNTPGFYSLGDGDPATAPVDRITTMTLADLDGDGQDEIALGFPAGVELPGNDAKIGKVYAIDPFVNDRAITAVTDVLLALFGPAKAVDWTWGSWLGGALAAGDLNADGAADLVVGAPTRQSADAAGAPEAGALYVVMGGNDHDIRIGSQGQDIQIGAVADAAKHRAIYAEAESYNDTTPVYPDGDRFGYAVAVADFDGDGMADIAVSAPMRTNGTEVEAGAVYIISGANWSNWPNGGSPRPVDQLSPVILRSTTAELRLGVSLAAGDVDGDGVADVVVGSGTTADAGTCAPPACGAVAILYGGRGFFGTGGRELVAETLDSDDGAFGTAPGGASDPLFGLGGTVAVVDLDLDGRGEVVAALGRPDQLTGGPNGVVLFRGADLPDALSGSTDASLTTHLVLQAPAGADSGFGAYIAAGDVNGDRRLDLLVGAPFAPLVRGDLPFASTVRPRPNAGALYVVLGSQLANYWDPKGDGSTVLSMDEIMAWDGGTDVTVPVVRVRGGLAQGFFGVSAATSSHLAQLGPEDPHSYTMVFQPGWFSTDRFREQNRGRLYTVDLQAALPCGAAARCVETCDNGLDDDQDGRADCDDPSCSADPACQQ